MLIGLSTTLVLRLPWQRLAATKSLESRRFRHRSVIDSIPEIAMIGSQYRRIATTILPPGSLCDLAQCSKPVKLETTILIYRHLPCPIQTEFQLRGLAPTATLVLRWNAVVQFLSIFERGQA